MSTALVFDSINTEDLNVKDLLEQHGYQVEVFSKQVASREVSISEPADLIVINLDRVVISDLEFCKGIGAKAKVPILLLAKEESELSTETILASAVSSYGVGVFDRKRLLTMADVAIERFRQMQSLKHELNRSKLQLEQRKVIERAKGLIMSHRGLNENDAYNHMRRTAMDQGKSMASFAEQIIEVFQIIE